MHVIYVYETLNDNSLWEIFSHARDAKPIFGTVLSIPGCHRLLAACYLPCWSFRVSFKIRKGRSEDFRRIVFEVLPYRITSFLPSSGTTTFRGNCSNDYSLNLHVTRRVPCFLSGSSRDEIWYFCEVVPKISVQPLSKPEHASLIASNS